jgi:hypothetical protein
VALSPTHKWGQIIGQEFLEVAMTPLLQEIASKHGLFLDTSGLRQPARSGRKISWKDLYGNVHDLDFVFERGGTQEQIGEPVAFIETSWRRYTKHSRNKAQEIQGAILPLVTTHQRHAPFVGVILAGEWTTGAMSQLKSLGFRVLYFRYEAIAASFRSVGIDASFEETTSNTECKKKINQWNNLSNLDRKKLGQHLLKTNKSEVNAFIESLERAILRQIESVYVLPLHGITIESQTILAAIETLEQYEMIPSNKPFNRFEIMIRYNNKDEVKGTFANREDAIEFLRSYLPIVRPAT